jgi:superfamily I DNA/RNA helicase
MDFRISDTFTASLAKLTGDEQKAAKTTAFDLQMDPASPGMQFHRLDRARDKNFWSVRVNRDIRLIVHRTATSLLLCYVDHHDAAYDWAERRKIERHPTTGAAQLVEVRETVQEIAIPQYVEQKQEAQPKPLLFSGIATETLLGYGVPEEWLSDVTEANEDTLFEIAGHLPSEAAEALLDLATGVTPKVATLVAPDVDPFQHPDAQRRFRVMANTEELAQALDYPWEKWAVFLHPSQRDLVDRQFNGPARVAGSAGTGKTVVALHRAARLARENTSARVLVTTFNDMLASALQIKLRHLIGNLPGVFERIEVYSIGEVGRRLYKSRFQMPNLLDDQALREIVVQAAAEVPHSFSEFFIWSEWRDIVDAWQLDSWETYRNVQRLGRKTRLREEQRRSLWTIFEKVRAKLSETNAVTQAMMFARVTEKLLDDGGGPYDYAIIDEAQDISIPEMRFLAALGATRPDSLFFAGDQGQRIFQTPFSWKALGVDIRGRSRILRINYRTSHQIRRQADQLLPHELSDVDGNKDDRQNPISAFDGPDPVISIFASEDAEIRAAGAWLKERTTAGVKPQDIGVFVRSSAQFERAKKAVAAAGLESLERVAVNNAKPGCVTLMTMHLAKGLEFRSVLVMACDDEIIPLQERIASVTDEADLEEVYNTERHLLYVACTRARDHLMVTGVDPASEFLDDLRLTSE